MIPRRIESRVFSRILSCFFSSENAFRLTLPKFRIVRLTNQDERGENFFALIGRSKASKLRDVKLKAHPHRVAIWRRDYKSAMLRFFVFKSTHIGGST